jgi:hypothetical protein
MYAYVGAVAQAARSKRCFAYMITCLLLNHFQVSHEATWRGCWDVSRPTKSSEVFLTSLRLGKGQCQQYSRSIRQNDG